jgi:hypothetical protein
LVSLEGQGEAPFRASGRARLRVSPAPPWLSAELRWFPTRAALSLFSLRRSNDASAAFFAVERHRRDLRHCGRSRTAKSVACIS